MEVSGGAGESDPVEAARSWLRDHGVEAVPEAPTRSGRPARLGEPAGSPEPHRSAESDLDRDSGSGEVPSGRPTSDGPADVRRGAASGPRRPEDADGAGRATASRDDGLDDPDADPEEVARRIVLRKLSAQARTRAELERALKSKAVPAEAAETVLDRMGEVGLVDDAAFARDWVASRQQRRHLSRTALRRELQTKGVDREVIDEALSDVEGADEHRAALDLAQRRAGTMVTLPREAAYRRLGGMLARRGFSSSVTTRVLAEVLGDWPED